MQRLHAYVEANGQLGGKHHEIYLGDTARAAPTHRETVIRHPMQGAEP